LKACQVKSGMSGSGRRLSTWQMTSASCSTTLGALCGQLTFRLAWCRQHSAVTATELCSSWTSLVELSSSPAAQSRHHLRTVQTTAEGTSFRRSMTSDMRHLKTLTYLLTYLLTYKRWPSCPSVVDLK